MKKRVAMLIGLLFIQQIMTEEITVVQNEVPKITGYQLYVMITEFIYAHTVLPFWIDINKARNAHIYCNACENRVDSFMTYTDLIARGNAQKILILKRLWHKKDVYKVEEFLYKVRNDLQIPCVRCLAFHGWHLKNKNNEILF